MTCYGMYWSTAHTIHVHKTETGLEDDGCPLRFVVYTYYTGQSSRQELRTFQHLCVSYLKSCLAVDSTVPLLGSDTVWDCTSVIIQCVYLGEGIRAECKVTVWLHTYMLETCVDQSPSLYQHLEVCILACPNISVTCIYHARIVRARNYRAHYDYRCGISAVYSIKKLVFRGTTVLLLNVWEKNVTARNVDCQPEGV